MPGTSGWTTSGPPALTLLWLVCRKHYREYLVSLINSQSLDPASLYSSSELLLACRRYKVDDSHREGEESSAYCSRLLEVQWSLSMLWLTDVMKDVRRDCDLSDREQSICWRSPLKLTQQIFLLNVAACFNWTVR